MSDFKFKIPIYEIVDETGALKFLFYYQTNIIPKNNETIVVLAEIDNNTDKMLYYNVESVLNCAYMIDRDVFNSETQPIIIYVKKILEEEKKVGLDSF